MFYSSITLPKEKGRGKLWRDPYGGLVVVVLSATATLNNGGGERRWVVRMGATTRWDRALGGRNRLSRSGSSGAVRRGLAARCGEGERCGAAEDPNGGSSGGGDRSAWLAAVVTFNRSASPSDQLQNLHFWLKWIWQRRRQTRHGGEDDRNDVVVLRLGRRATETCGTGLLVRDLCGSVDYGGGTARVNNGTTGEVTGRGVAAGPSARLRGAVGGDGGGEECGSNLCCVFLFLIFFYLRWL